VDFDAQWLKARVVT